MKKIFTSLLIILALSSAACSLDISSSSPSDFSSSSQSSAAGITTNISIVLTTNIMGLEIFTQDLDITNGSLISNLRENHIGRYSNQFITITNTDTNGVIILSTTNTHMEEYAPAVVTNLIKRYTRHSFFDWYSYGTYYSIQGLSDESDAASAADIELIAIPWEYNGKPVMAVANSIGFNNPNPTKTIIITPALTNINGGAFVYANYLENFVMDTNSLYYTVSNGILYNRDFTILVCYPRAKGQTAFAVPQQITEIGEQAFMGNNTLKELQLPEGLIKIGNSAFTGSRISNINFPASCMLIDCYAFQNIVYLNHVEILTTNQLIISNRAFDYCNGLYDVKIGTGLVFIDDNAFARCGVLTNISIDTVVPPAIGINVFSNSTALQSISVPAASVTSYKNAAGWSNYSDLIIAR